MNYGILINKNDEQQIKNYDSGTGFRQWLNVFHGWMIPADDALLNLKDGDFDIIHIRLCRENLIIIHHIREKLGLHSNTKIVLSLDIPVHCWDKEFDHPDQLKKAVWQADFVFATEYPIAQALEGSTGKNIYEIPHPVNVDKIKNLQNILKEDMITILGRSQVIIKKYIAPLKFLFQSNVRIRVLSDGYGDKDDVEYYRRKNIDFIVCKTNEDLYMKLAESRFIIISEIRSCDGNEDQHYENLVVYSAITGAIVLDGKQMDVIHRCYSEITSTPFINHLRYNCFISKFLETFFHCSFATIWYWRLKDNAVKINYLSEYAQSKAEYYYWESPPKRFLNLLYRETNDPRFLIQDLKSEHPSILKQIRHIHGPKTVNYHQEEFVVVCLVKNGEEYIKSFIDHYNHLEAKHFFFIDNGSADETVSLLKQYRNITIYKTELPHKKYECEIRRAVIEEHCKNNWCLCVDIDKLFDYPYSHRVSMKLFLRYLNSHQYTAVLSYLLDMFSKELEFSPKKQEEDIISKYCYYDLSNIRKKPYHKLFTAFTKYNKLADQRMKNYFGGIRGSVFKNKESGYLLTKHPLIFVNSKIEPVVHPHFCNKAFIADVNGVVKHYKFISSFKDKVIDSLKSQNYCYYAEQEYKEYFNIIKVQDKLCLYSRKSKKLENVEQFVRQGFLRVSKIYQAYVKSIYRQ